MHADPWPAPDSAVTHAACLPQDAAPVPSRADTDSTSLIRVDLPIREIEPGAGCRLPELIGDAPCMLEVSRRIRLVAQRMTTVLIEGPTGSGKELVAEALHRLSPRSRKPFVAINCAAIPEALLEAELFGHTRGAFTGAVKGRIGRIESADGGTLFLD
jgi:transcriptional regulator with GAF, ATPase, and Fis domain